MTSQELQTLRLAKGLTLSEVATATKIPIWHLNLLETGERIVTKKSEAKLAHLLRPEGDKKDLILFRNSLRLTQKEAADLAGIGYRTWQRYESGKRRIPAAFTESLRELFASIEE